jgi:nitroreductase
MALCLTGAGEGRDRRERALGTRTTSMEDLRWSAVAAGVENMVLVAQALGYGAMWKTGAAAYDAQAKTTLGLSAQDHIVAFLYLGTTALAGTATPASLDGIVTWTK